MQRLLNGAFAKKIEDINCKLFTEGLEAVSDRELQLLLLDSQNKELQALSRLADNMHSPFWRQWPSRDLMTGGVILLGIIGAVNWSVVVSFAGTILGSGR